MTDYYSLLQSKLQSELDAINLFHSLMPSDVADLPREVPVAGFPFYISITEPSRARNILFGVLSNVINEQGPLLHASAYTLLRHQAVCSQRQELCMNHCKPLVRGKPTLQDILKDFPRFKPDDPQTHGVRSIRLDEALSKNHGNYHKVRMGNGKAGVTPQSLWVLYQDEESLREYIRAGTTVQTKIEIDCQRLR